MGPMTPNQSMNQLLRFVRFLGFRRLNILLDNTIFLNQLILTYLILETHQIGGRTQD